MNDELLFNEIYEKTKNCGRTQFVRLLMDKERENKELKEKLETSEKARKEAIEFINKELEEIGKHQYAIGTRRLNRIKNILDIDKGE